MLRKRGGPGGSRANQVEGRAHASLYRRLLFSSRLELWGVKRLCCGHSFIPGRLLPSIATAASGRDTPHKQVFIHGRA